MVVPSSAKALGFEDAVGAVGAYGAAYVDGVEEGFMENPGAGRDRQEHFPQLHRLVGELPAHRYPRRNGVVSEPVLTCWKRPGRHEVAGVEHEFLGAGSPRLEVRRAEPKGGSVRAGEPVSAYPVLVEREPRGCPDHDPCGPSGLDCAQVVLVCERPVLLGPILLFALELVRVLDARSPAIGAAAAAFGQQLLCQLLEGAQADRGRGAGVSRRGGPSRGACRTGCVQQEQRVRPACESLRRRKPYLRVAGADRIGQLAVRRDIAEHEQRRRQARNVGPLVVQEQNRLPVVPLRVMGGLHAGQLGPRRGLRVVIAAVGHERVNLGRARALQVFQHPEPEFQHRRPVGAARFSRRLYCGRGHSGQVGAHDH